MMKRTLVVAAVLAVTAAGCGNSDDDKKTTAEPTASYVETVNKLCEALIDEVVPVTGDAAPLPTRARYLSNDTKLAPIYQAFDAKLDKIPVRTADDRKADKALDAYRAGLAAMDVDLGAKVKTLSETEWAAAIKTTYDEYFASPVPQALNEIGIRCPAR